MGQDTYEFDSLELKGVDEYIEHPSFDDSLTQEENLVESTREGISRLLQTYGLDENTDVYQQKLKQIADHHLTYLEDIDNQLLSNIFHSERINSFDDDFLDIEQLNGVA